MEKKTSLSSLYDKPADFESALVELLRERLRNETWNGSIGNDIVPSKFHLDNETSLLEIRGAGYEDFLITTKRVILRAANHAESMDLSNIAQVIRGTESQRHKLDDLRKQSLELANRYYNTEIRNLTLISNDGFRISLSFESIPLMRAIIDLIYSIQRRERWRKLPATVRKKISEYPSTTHNRQVLKESDVCGCISCLQIFPSEKIVDWRDTYESSTGETALCPYCGDDSVVGSASGVPINRKRLSELNETGKTCF
jgi:hypothetical protein